MVSIDSGCSDGPTVRLHILVGDITPREGISKEKKRRLESVRVIPDLFRGGLITQIPTGSNA